MENTEPTFGTNDPDTPYGTEEFYRTSKGKEFLAKLKNYRKQAEQADREAQRLENEATRLATEALSSFYPESQRAKVDSARKAAWQARDKHSELLAGQRTIQNSITRTLMNWRTIRKSPSMYHVSQATLVDLKEKLKQSLAKEDYMLCAEIKQHLEDNKLAIETWERTWITATGDPIPPPPKDEAFGVAPLPRNRIIRGIMRLN